MKRAINVAGVATVGALLFVAGCGDDDDASADEEYAGFCTAELAAEQATNGEDPEAIGAAFAALLEATPDESKAVVERVIAAAEEMFAAEEQGPPPEEFDAAYAEMVTIVKDNCGFDELTVTAQDYSFAGADAAESGPTVINFENEGSEFHELVLFRKNDGVTTPIEELLELGEEEASGQVTFVGAAFAAPGATGHTVLDVEPGNYAAICFIPVGMTADALEAAMESGEEPDGPPHFTQGMVVEFEVD